MENTAYNRKILDQVKEINNRYLEHLKNTGREVLDSNMVPLVEQDNRYVEKLHGGDMTGGFSFADLSPLAMLGLGKPKRRVGRPCKKGGSVGVDAQAMQQNELTGNGFFDTLKDVAKAKKALTKKKRGRPSKKGGIIKTAGMRPNYGMKSDPIVSGNVSGGIGARAIGSGKSEMQGAGFFDTLGDIAKTVAPFAMMALGKDGKPKRKRTKKGGAISGGAVSGGADMQGAGFFDTLGDIAKTVAPFAMMALGKDGKPKRKRTKKGGAISGGADMKGAGFFDNFMSGALPHGGAKSGAGWFDDVVSGIGSVVKTAADVAPHAIGAYNKYKGRGKTAGAVSGGAKKTSPWISHVKAFAKHHKMNYSEALKHPQCKASYKK